MSLKNYPIYFDNTEILRPTKWQKQSDVVESVKRSEAGTDLVDVVRLDKMSISAEFGVTGAWAKIFKDFSLQASIQVRMYDTAAEGYETRTMRIRNYKENLRKGSELVAGKNINGVWDVSFTLKEF